MKTTVFTERELDQLAAWAKRVANAVHVQKWSMHFADYADLGYYKHLDHPSRWRLRKAIEQGLGSAMRLHSPRLEAFGRCVVLRTGQWALDGRKNLPSLHEFREMLTENATAMVAGARELLAAVRRYPKTPKVRILNRSAAGLEDDERLMHLPAPKLVITSPPYPGVHVLYHRWQVDGRKEAPLPFMIADKPDGAGSSYYTMGDRKYPELKSYFNNIHATMSSVTALADENTTIVQMVAFSDPSWQLERYLDAMERAGLTEVFLPQLHGAADGRLWRQIPNRKWHANQLGDIPPSQEVVLFFRRTS